MLIIAVLTTVLTTIFGHLGGALEVGHRLYLVNKYHEPPSTKRSTLRPCKGPSVSALCGYSVRLPDLGFGFREP